MIYREHYIELFVNGNQIELEDQKSLNMRFNNVIYDPTKISSTQSEYSFEFEVPATPNNNKIFDYADNLSKTNKFHQRYNAEVYADGTIIFGGTITLNSFKDNKYSVNLVSVKVYSLDDIFGDMTMNKIKNWKIPFEGAGDTQYTIDWYNSQLETDVTFPLVSYGAFQKNPKYSDDAGSEYTSKFDFDEYNKWYIESFYPSANVLETLKKAFETVDYSVGGDVFTNPYLKGVYASANLADGQDPEYNVGNPKFGKIDLSATFSTNSTVGYVQNLKFPYYKVGGISEYVDGKWVEIEEGYNLEAVQLYDILAEGNVTVNQAVSYSYQPNEHIIVIPADGFYKINMEIDTTLQTTNDLTAELNYRGVVFRELELRLDNELTKGDVTFHPDFLTTTPVEIQLVRNYDDNLELIKGKNNMYYVDGIPDNEYPGTMSDLGHNKVSFYTCFPHEKLGYFSDSFPIPTKTDDLGSRQQYTSNVSTDGLVNGGADTMMYDPIVNPDFVCGFSSMGNNNGSGSAAIIKNGYSWSKQRSEKIGSFYNQEGYYKVDRISGSIPDYEYRFTPTEYNKNELYNSPTNYFTEFIGGTNMKGRLTGIVHLNKNDRLQLFCVHRDYNNTEGNSVTYNSTTNVNLTIEAYSPKSYAKLKKDNENDWSKPTQFDTLLNVPNFFNKEKKISEWVQGIADAFNLDIIQSGKHVDINMRKKLNNISNIAVDIDDRVNSADAEASMIEYPRSMAVKYKIDTDEWGFEQSAEKAINSDPSIDPSILDDEDEWKQYGDSGYTVIQLNDDSYVTTTSDKSLPFSYTWYDKFNWYEVNSQHQKISNVPITLNIPVISKYQYMIDGYDYTESLKHDGYGLSQRFWFKPEQSNAYVWTDVYPAQKVTLYEPKNLFTNYRDVYFNLSYKNTESSILTNFFNIGAFLSSNYVEVDVYLSPDEYNRIKNGSLVHVDSDLYYPVEINGYDASGNNPTTLKLMKRVN